MSITVEDLVRAMPSERQMVWLLWRWRENPEGRDEYEKITMTLAREKGIPTDFVKETFKAMRHKEEKSEEPCNH